MLPPYRVDGSEFCANLPFSAAVIDPDPGAISITALRAVTCYQLTCFHDLQESSPVSRPVRQETLVRDLTITLPMGQDSVRRDRLVIQFLVSKVLVFMRRILKQCPFSCLGAILCLRCRGGRTCPNRASRKFLR